MLHTCALSRSIALQYVEPGFGLPKLINFDIDILCFPSATKYHHFPLLVDIHPDVTRVKYLAGIGNEEWPGIDWYLLAHRMFPSLQHVFMVKQSLFGNPDHVRKEMARKDEGKAFEMLVNGPNLIPGPNVTDGSNEQDGLSGKYSGAFTMMFKEEFRDMLRNL